MKYVKLTDQDMQTFNGYQWVVGEKRTASGSGELCTEGWLHCYGAETQGQAVLLALLLNPIHGDFPSTLRCFSAECGGQIRSDAGLKFGATEMTLREEITLLPEITTITRVAFGIFCAMEVVKDRTFVAWASAWLSGADRSRRSARRAADAVERSAERAVAVAAVEAVERAAERAVAVAAVRALEAESVAALEAEPAAALEAAARAAMRALEAESVAALEAAELAARRAVAAATASGVYIPLGELAEKAMEIS